MSDAAYQDALTRLRNGPQQGPTWTISELRTIAQSLSAQAKPGTTTILWGGTLYLDGAPGRVMPVDRGPRVAGLVEAKRRLGQR